VCVARVCFTFFHLRWGWFWQLRCAPHGRGRGEHLSVVVNAGRAAAAPLTRTVAPNVVARTVWTRGGGGSGARGDVRQIIPEKKGLGARSAPRPIMGMIPVAFTDSVGDAAPPSPRHVSDPLRRRPHPSGARDRIPRGRWSGRADTVPTAAPPSPPVPRRAGAPPPPRHVDAQRWRRAALAGSEGGGRGCRSCLSVSLLPALTTHCVSTDRQCCGRPSGPRPRVGPPVA